MIQLKDFKTGIDPARRSENKRCPRYQAVDAAFFGDDPESRQGGQKERMPSRHSKAVRDGYLGTRRRKQSASSGTALKDIDPNGPTACRLTVYRQVSQ